MSKLKDCIHKNICCPCRDYSEECQKEISMALSMARETMLCEKAAVFENGYEFVIYGNPKEDGEHNCDMMGCASAGPHILMRVPKSDEILKGF